MAMHPKSNIQEGGKWGGKEEKKNVKVEMPVSAHIEKGRVPFADASTPLELNSRCRNRHGRYRSICAVGVYG